MKKIYKNIGIGLLVANIFLLVTGNFLKFLTALIVLPNFYSYLSQMISVNGQYNVILLYLLMSLDALLTFWGIVLSIILIKNNRYNKQLLWWIYSWVGIKILSFILFLPLKIYETTDLVIAVLFFVFLIYQDNKWSRIIKNKLPKNI
ncbi:MAG: hypothetical protein WCV73_01805 [Patescibacteria group bacterium]|jgi:hypothetical protein